MLLIASIDIGIHNTPLVVEEFNEKKLRECKAIPIKKRFNLNREPTEEFKKILKQVYLNGKVVFFSKQDFLIGEKLKKNTVDDLTLFNISDWLKSLPILYDIDFILIEKQLKTNPVAQIIEKHIRSVLSEILRDNIELGICSIIPFDSYHKTKVLGAPKLINGKKMTKPQRKNWSCSVFTEIMLQRSEEDQSVNGMYQDIILGNKKYDDESDCFLMNQAGKVRLFLDDEDFPKGRKERRNDFEMFSLNLPDCKKVEFLSDTYSYGSDVIFHCVCGNIFMGKICQFLNSRSGCWKCLLKEKEIEKKEIEKKIEGKIINNQGILEKRGKIQLMCKNKHKFWRSKKDIFSKWCLECKRVEIVFD